MKMITARLGPLTCRIIDVDRTAPPDLVCVLCHGYGAPGTDLVGVAGELLSLAPALSGRVRFVFPEAPISLDFMPFEGRAWWHIDVGRFQRALEGGELEALLHEVPDGLPQARKALLAALDELCRQSRVPMGKVVLGGFSQGAMLTTDVALRLEEAPAGLAILSGTLLCKDEWERLLPKRRGLPVLQSHGTADPILPYAAAEELRALLTAAGLDVTFVRFMGGHGIDLEVLEKLAALLASRLDGARA
jgi:phospholipase/carboxylesterase